MKNILIAASLIGAAAAGTILYMNKKRSGISKPSGRLDEIADAVGNP